MASSIKPAAEEPYNGDVSFVRVGPGWLFDVPHWTPPTISNPMSPSGHDRSPRDVRALGG
jgi:hypothetical protein